MRASVRGLRRNVKAAFVTFHVLAIGAAALPGPVGGMDRRTWQTPTIKHEMAGWSRLLGVDPERFEHFLWSLAAEWMALRDRLNSPFRAYIGATGCDQPWRMFAGADRFPTRFHLQAHVAGTPAGTWETLFAERSEIYTWHRSLFEYDRFRAALQRYAFPRYDNSYHVACRFFARAVFRERLDVDRVRCLYLRTRSPSADEAVAGVEPEGHWERTLVVNRTRTNEDP